MSVVTSEQSTEPSAGASHTGTAAERAPVPYQMPAEPVVTIEAGKRWAPLNLRDAWAYRELLYFLIWRDVKVRYKQTILGALWAVIQPLFTMVIFTYFFGKLARVPTDGVPYPVFFYTGLLLWSFFSNSLVTGSASLVGNTNLITKVYFPRLLIPAATVFAGLLDVGIASLLLVVLLVYYSIPIGLGMLMVVPLVALATLLALAISIFLSALNVKYRDVRYALPFLTQVWLFVSPIIYPASMVPEQWRWVLTLNPLTGLIENFRAALLGTPFRWPALGYSLICTLVLLVYSAYAFRRMERSFAEVI